MDFIDRVQSAMFGRGGLTSTSPATLLKFTKLEPSIQRHLSRVYLTLLCATALVTVGCTLATQFYINTWMSLLAGMGAGAVLAFTPNTPQNMNKRLLCLAGVALAQGTALAPLVQVAAAVSPALVVTALLATLAVFTCFTLAALITPRRSYLYLGAFLSSAVLGLWALRLGGWLFGASALTYSLELYSGLLVFTGYVLVDTQVIVERAAAGNLDVVDHTLFLLVDLVAIFVRVLTILIRSTQEKERRERGRASRRDK
ncbi:inhibitor of apoptosis-promoting Bax1-domain-containing protein [Haematococcus lacustris]